MAPLFCVYPAIAVILIIAGILFLTLGLAILPDILKSSVWPSTEDRIIGTTFANFRYKTHLSQRASCRLGLHALFLQFFWLDGFAFPEPHAIDFF